jgi:TolB-like protein
MKKTIVIFLVALLLPSALSAQKKESLALFPFTGGNASDGTAIVSSLARQAILRNAFNRTTLVTQNIIATMNFEQRFQRNSGLTDADTIFELGKALNASHVIAGYITKLGDRNLVVVSIMDVESLQQIAGDYRAYRSIEEVDALIPAIAKKLADAVPKNTNNLPGLSVPPFNISSDVQQNDAMVLAQILSCDLANSGKFAVLPRTDSLEMVIEEHQRQRSGVTDQERIMRLGVGRNAQFVLSGSVQRLGTLNKFTADIIDILNGDFIDGCEESYTNFAQGVEVMPKLAVLLAGTSINTPTTVTAATTAVVQPVPAAPTAPVATTPAQSSYNTWKPNNDAKSTVRLNTGIERIDGRDRDVLTIAINVARSVPTWAGARCEDAATINKMKTGTGIRFKVLGDGKSWELMIATSDTLADSAFHRATVATRNGRVVEIEIPYSKLRQPDWGKKVSFNKNNIRGLNMERNNNSGTGASTIKIFDFEVY